jgi:hypothetical protein
MAKPRVFISSTYYDLKYIRDGLETFITGMGYEPILFEKGDIPFHPDKTLEESCYREVESSDILIMLIGGRYGGLSKEDEERVKMDPDSYFGRIRSITNKEYENALSRNIATFIFVEQSVFAEYRTYKQNISNDNIKYAHVDDPRIYAMVNDIMSQRKGNFLKDFSNLDEITTWLRDQWAGIFVDLLRKRNSSDQITNLENQIDDLTDVVKTLKIYSETLIREVNKNESKVIIAEQEKRIVTGKTRRLMSEPMINYLGRAQAPSRMLDSLLKSSNIEQFLTKIGLSDSNAKKFLDENGSPARKDYTELKKRYASDVAEPAVTVSRSSTSRRPRRKSSK